MLYFDLSKVVYILTMLAAICTIFGSLEILLKSIISIYSGLSLNKPIERLCSALNFGNSIASQAEIKYQIKNFIFPKLIYNNVEFSVKQLLKKILEMYSGQIVLITGKPAMGKTTLMRYLYCKLIKKYRCAFIQMKGINSIQKIVEKIETQIRQDNRQTDKGVIIFLDGLDEAIRWQIENKGRIENWIISLFDPQSDNSLYNILCKDKKIDVFNFIFSLRPEMLEDVQSLFGYNNNNLSTSIYEISKMSEKNIIKMFKSLKQLVRLEKKYTDIDKRRHQYRYPKIWEEWKYIRFFKKLLRNDKTSIFYYPMFVRYAYPFMKYYEQQNLNENFSEDNIQHFFQILLKAIYKWEYHIYYDTNRNTNGNEFEIFEQAMDNCTNNILKKMLEKQEKDNIENKYLITQDELETILDRCKYGNNDRFVIAHCLMSSDDNNQNYEFCHFSFFEYFLAKYLYCDADYECRKKYLGSICASKNMRDIYYSFVFYQNEDMAHSFKQRINSYKDFFMLETQDEVEIDYSTKLYLIDILKYFPFIRCMKYCESLFNRRDLEKIMNGVLDLTKTNWQDLNNAEKLAPFTIIKECNLSGLPLFSVNALSEYVNLEVLDIRSFNLPESILYQILNAIKNLNLLELKVYICDSNICKNIYEFLRENNLDLKVFVETENYSDVHIKLSELNQESQNNYTKKFFFLMNRSTLEGAKNQYYKDDKIKNIELLKAVFDLEKDEDGILGLDKEDSEASLWNGLSIVSWYLNEDYKDENNFAFNICNSLKQHIVNPDSELSIRFGQKFSKILISKNKANEAKERLIIVHNNALKYVSQEDYIEITLDLYRAYLFCSDYNLDYLNDCIKNNIKQIDNYRENWRYIKFVKLYCVLLLKNWIRNTLPNCEIGEMIYENIKVASLYAKKNLTYGYLYDALYLNLIYCNRKEKYTKAKRLIKNLEDLLLKIEKTKTKSNRNVQGYWLQYMEQKIYYLLLTKKADECIINIENVLAYPYRHNEKPIKEYNEIKEYFISNDTNNTSKTIDKHVLWHRIWW